MQTLSLHMFLHVYVFKVLWANASLIFWTLAYESSNVLDNTYIVDLFRLTLQATFLNKPVSHFVVGVFSPPSCNTTVFNSACIFSNF